MNHEENIDLDFLQIQYQVLSNRQLAHNTSVWNVPALLFTAESILWGISLDSESSIVSCAISLVAVLIALASWQQFERGRLMEIADSEQLYAIEAIMKKAGGNSSPVMIVHKPLVERTLSTDSGEIFLKDRLSREVDFYKNNPLTHFRRFYVWRIMFLIICLLSLFLFFYNLYVKWPFL